VQASSVAETSASIDQMVTSIQRVADTAKVLLDIANRSPKKSVTGIQTMEKLQTLEPHEQGNSIVRGNHMSSAKRADDIGKIIEVI